MSDTGTGAIIGVFLASLIPAFLFSRVFLWLLQARGRVLGGAVIANALSLATIGTLAALGHLATGEAFSFADVLLRYLLPQLFWLGVDLVLLRRRARKATAP
jgi:hypothetical protein